MFKVDPKYHRKAAEAAAELPAATAEVPPFDLERMRSTGWKARLGALVFEHPDWWLGLLRRFWPRARFGRFVILTRDSDVRDVLLRQADFETPYAAEMTEFGGGANFILGMPDSEQYRRLKSVILSAFPPLEVEARVRPIAARRAREIVTAAGMSLNAARDLFGPVSSTICREYYGVAVDDDRAFSDWGLALSSLFFGDPTADRTVRENAITAARNMHDAIGRSIDAVEASGALRDMPLDRLVGAMKQGRIERADVHSFMMGMITGFGPTTLLGGGNCLDVTLSRREIFDEMAAAVAARDDKRLELAIGEAMRFKPIFVSPWRYARTDQEIGAGTDKPYVIPADTVVWPSTRSAMFDKRAVPDADLFKPGRPEQDSLVFGYGIHKCIGAALARVQTAECFRALFSRSGFGRAPGKAGKLTRIGPYPDKIMVTFDPADRQSMVTVVLPLKADVRRDEVAARLDALGNPSNGDVRQKLDATGTIHFASMSVVETGVTVQGVMTHHLILELSGDGRSKSVLATFGRVMEAPLRDVLAEGLADPPGKDLAKYLQRHTLSVSPNFGGSNGIVFCGSPGHSVHRIIQEDQLAKTAIRTVEKLSAEPGVDAASVLQAVRDQLRLTPGFDWAFTPTENHLDDAPKGLWSAARATLLSASVFATLTLVGLACWALTYYQLFYPTSQWLQFFMRVGAAFVLSLMGVSITLMIAAGVALIWLRRLETSDRPSSASISVNQLRALQEREDRAVQNHMTAVSVIKPGPLRRLMLRLTFYLISISATHVFKPGLLSSIGTIHFARWVSIPNTNRLVFLSNYGGSWESYLEDFIAKASKGLTGIWSNTEGYPVTRFLFFSGARDGDRFKRWARTQQVPTNFWYSAYPHLSTTLIRKNALIRSGIASAKLSEARDWINLFSSTERQEGVRPSGLQKLLSGVPASAETLEEGEIQSIAFGPMGRLRHGLMLGFRVVDDTSRACRKVWLEQLTRYLAFGDARQASTAAIAFFGPDGLRQLGLDGEAGNQLMGGFPLAFRQGMANPYRSRILDDTGPNDPQNWLWGADANPVDVIVNCYAATAQELDELVAGLEKMSSANGIDIVHRLSLVLNDAPAKRGERPKALDQFGFVDGISQPVLRGAGRDVGGMHEVNPGEFLFGYRDEHGFYPPTPTLPSSADPTGILRPINVEGAICAGPADIHDFGRNGSFVVVRQLQQHVELFDGYCAGAAGELSKQMRANVSPDWVGARIVGRWKDGSSLVRNPHAPGGGAPDNDFNFGADDPQGLKCPLGAHVRRSNPRGSLSNDLDTQLRITNRHRILRVGRTYIAEQGAMDPEKGLLFVCLNASIERQYEFIQQTWMAAGNFHGLRGEKDPLMGTQSVDEVGDPVGRLAIPRWEGSIALQSMPSFVTMRGGGYYFMPSRAALRYLASRLG